jgi:MFS family permease
MLNLAVLVPLGTIFLVQSLLTMAAYGISVIIPDAAADIGIRPELVGLLSGTLYLFAMVSGPLTAPLLRRFGPTRLFQLLVGMMGLGALALIGSHPALAFVGAIIMGLATGPMNPTGSHVLARATALTWQPLVFSLKQCGTPAGGMLAGAALPALVLAYNWQVALALLPVGAIVLICVAPLGRLGGRPTEPEPPRALLSEIGSSLRSALSTRALISVALSGAILGACQLAVASYYVVFLWRAVGMTTLQAGQVFVFFHIVGILARVALGFLAQRVIATRYLFSCLGVFMAAGTAAAATLDEYSSTLTVYLITALLGIGGNGWVGLFFAELARLAPQEAAKVAGGGQFIMYLGIVIGPVVFALLLNTTGSFQVCLNVFAVLALLTVVPLARELFASKAK